METDFDVSTKLDQQVDMDMNALCSERIPEPRGYANPLIRAAETSEIMLRTVEHIPSERGGYWPGTRKRRNSTKRTNPTVTVSYWKDDLVCMCFFGLSAWAYSWCMAYHGAELVYHAAELVYHSAEQLY